MTATQLSNTTCTCPSCGGSGKLPHFSHIQNGDCFACGGTGTIQIKDFIGSNSDVALDVMLRNGEFWYATLRCRTWRVDGNGYKTWGKDRWYHEISDAAEAREIWRIAKVSGIKTSCGE